MSFGIWSEKYSVQNVIIDEQHRRLLDILFRLERLVNRKSHPDEMVKLLKEMTDYAAEHFKSEERYMERIGYPRLSAHQEAHSRYTLEVLKYTLQHLEAAPDNPRELLNFLTHWWTDHILKVDMDYSKFAARQELSKL
ncbi:MAG: hemerythrin family protein [Flavobacteriales bacterium]|nr:hemerythrin family protein [Flavobacteriales bacterium]MCB9185286.1 hemerythrin family protein [Flavobacteriales bacterium]